jgi:diguanylate cyclase (GGDEF)-like protein
MNPEPANRRILIIDDNQAIHTDVRSVLASEDHGQEIEELSASLFGTDEKNSRDKVKYEIDSAYQGQEGYELVKQALAENRPYALAFVDMRMPPGWDGIQTIQEIKKIDAHLQVTICTAFSDYSWQATLDILGMSDWLLILKKPFDVVEVQQLAYALTEKWNLAKRASMRTEELEQLVSDHAVKLELANAQLLEQVDSLAEANRKLSREMDARHEADERIRHMAYHDSLTSLPNRLMLIEKIGESISHSKNTAGYRFAVLYCDIDNFKLVNDSLGHRVGDQLLLQVAHRFTHALRTSEYPPRGASDMVARLSGDEFVILLDDISTVDNVLQIAERMKDAVSQNIAIDQNELLPSLSIGVAVCSGEYSDPTDLLRDADTALYNAKANGKGCVALFDQDMRAKVTARMNLEHDLRRAIDEKQFVVYYQPIVSLQTQEVVSAEALARWQHPTQGLILPGGFIPVAEETGMIEAIGELVLEESVRQVAQWRATISGMENLGVNVNLSPRQLVDRSIIGRVDKCLQTHELAPGALRLEITESAMMNDLTMVLRFIEDLAARGIEIHLDDFGTGYSSLSILHTLPFNTIKLDRSFVSNLGMELESPTTVQAIVMLAKNRQVKVVAEGIESYDQMTHLRRLDCDYGQGYYFSKPLPPEEFVDFFRQNREQQTASGLAAYQTLVPQA